MNGPQTNSGANEQAISAHTIALNALVWTLQEPTRAERFLSLTGLQADDISARINDPALLDAVLAFLEAHEPDLVACSKALEVLPAILLGARAALGK